MAKKGANKRRREIDSRSIKKRPIKKQAAITYILVLAVAIVVTTACMIKTAELREKSRDLAVTENSLQEKLDDETKKQEELKTKEAYMETDEYIEEEAKEKFELVYPDEIVIKPNN